LVYSLLLLYLVTAGTAVVNDILRNGDTFKLENLSYKAFQKLFGASEATLCLLNCSKAQDFTTN
ncbi:MAG TPA: hypothetical protein DEP38_05835, partial [Cyanobacteria bacterium UBA9226]|nr:hypothetical protein [Cyanobacteria bacterium UBA9226]